MIYKEKQIDKDYIKCPHATGDRACRCKEIQLIGVLAEYHGLTTLIFRCAKCQKVFLKAILTSDYMEFRRIYV